MTHELTNEWISIVDYPDLYLYGAKKTAESLYDLIVNMGYKEHIKGFLVTDGANNEKQLCGLPVYDVHSFKNKDARILVPHKGVYKKQISDLLNSLGFSNIFFVFQIMDRTSLEERGYIASDNRKVGWEIYDKKSEDEKMIDASIRNAVVSILQEGQPDFGGIIPYQSLELIGLEGIRPTEYRIREYELRKILKSQHDVLDIGCNSGFFDIIVSDLVHSVTGIEYDKSLVKVADLVKDYLKVSNCTFYHGDFNDWYKKTNTRYDVIFSFAIHHWLNLAPQEYVAIIDNLLNVQGYFVFESHVASIDTEFYECCEELKRLDYKIICEKKINDSGLQERQYVLWQKTIS